jgi:hypothetical protein
VNRTKIASDLEPGDVLALPFNRRATITEVRLGRRYANLKFREYPPSRVQLTEEVLLEAQEEGITE